MYISDSQLEFHEDDIEELAYFEGKPFTGKTEENKAGYLRKSAYKNGYEHGVSEGYFPNGYKCYERHYIEGIEVKTTDWFECGRIKEKKECIVPTEYDYEFQRWNESGVLVYKTNTELNETQGWYESGELKFLQTKELSEYYTVDGKIAFYHLETSPHEDNSPFGKVRWNDEIIETCFEYLANDDLLFVFIWHWLEMRLDEKREIGERCLEVLANNSNFNTMARAIHLIGYRNIASLKYILEKNLDNILKQPLDSSGWQGPIGSIASKALSAISANKRVN